MQAEIIPLEKIAESPTNPRRVRNEAQDAELVESVRRHGVLQAVLVRPKPPGGYELVVGSRRYRAALAAGLAEIPASVRAMSDLEVLEVQVIENSQRADVHPLEEAEAFERLHNAHGLSVDEIAAKLGKSKAFVYARMKLCALGKEGRAAFYDGKMEASVALLVARVPAKLQPEAVKAVTSEEQWREGDRMGAREAADHIRRTFMLDLREATFATDDATLVPKAGACSVCPKRTGNQPELFGDVKSADVCTDPVCFRAKADATWERKKAEAERSGRKVLEGKRAQDFARGAVSLDDRCYEDPKGRTYRKILGKDAPDAVLVRERDGDVRELLPRTAATAAVRAAGVVARKTHDSLGRSVAQQTKDEIRRRTANAAIAAVVDQAATFPKRGLEWWRFLADRVIGEVWHESVKAATTAREVSPPKKSGGYGTDWSKALRGWAAEASEADLVKLVVELLIRRDAFGNYRDDIGEALRAGCKFAGVELAPLRTAAAREVAAKNEERRKKAAKAKRAKAPPKKKAAAKPRRKAAKKRGAA